jgi:tetratricopeptide (TPR) repeat protein
MAASRFANSVGKGLDWLLERPRRVVAALAVVGLLVRHAWITTLPLAAGDWHSPTRGRVLQWFPWPSVWDPTLGFSGENRFLDAFRFPVFAVNGLIAALGGTYTLVEKIDYFIPFAVLLPVAGWLVAREILGNTRWTLLAPLILLGNTYLLINGDGEIPLVLGEVIGCLTLVAFIRAMRRLSLKWALIAGLALAATAAYDVRPAFLTGLLIAGYVLVLAVGERGWGLLGRRVSLAGAAALTFLGTQMFWVVPLLTYHGHRQLPTPQAPNLNIITLGHALAGVAAGWSGGNPATLVEAPLDPLFLLLPLIAMLVLARRKLTPELLWLALAAVVAAFLAKTNTPPFGFVYNWIYRHVPGFSLFREGSKFFYPIALAYAVLIPASLSGLVEGAGERRARARKWLRAGVTVGLVAVVAISAVTISVLERGLLGSSTTPVAEPKSFTGVAAAIHADHHHGAVLWFGAPTYTTTAFNDPTDSKTHRYVIASATHPLTNLTGDVTPTAVNRRDVFQYYCGSVTAPYCYVNRTVFPYLAHQVEATYIVSPAGSDVGHLPGGVSRQWLASQLTAMFGSPRQFGTGTTELLMWHVSNPAPAVSSYPAVALVQSGPWSLPQILPALQALGVPAAYRQTFDKADFPPAPAALSQTVGVSPLIDGRYVATGAGSTAIMARTPAPALTVRVDGGTKVLPLLERPSRLPQWGVYGSLAAGYAGQTITSSAPLGPALQWSALTRAALGGFTQPVGVTKVSAHGERLTASLSGTPEPWTELRRLYDFGWRLHGEHPAAVGDGLFNLYHPARPGGTRHRLVFTFSTLPWEHRGDIAAAAVLLLALGLIWRRSVRERAASRTPVPAVPFEGRWAPVAGGLAVAFIGLATVASALEWAGLFSKAPHLAITPDPYSLDTVFETTAMALIGVSLVMRLGGRVLERAAARVPALDKRRRRQVALVAAGSMMLASCGVGAGGGGAAGGQALAQAQRAGAPSATVIGDTLDEARVQQQAKNPRRCIVDYTKALKTFPNLASAYAGRAGCYRSGNIDSPAAIHDLTRAIAISPDDPALYLKRAAADRGIGNLAAAVGDYQEAASVPSSTGPDLLAAIDGLIAVGADAQAIHQVVSVAVARYPQSPFAALAQAAVATGDGDNAAAARALATARRQAAGSNTLVFVLSRLCQDQVVQQLYQAAVATCSQATTLGSGNAGAYDNLSAAELELGRLSAAISDMTSAIGVSVGNVGPNAQPAGVDGYGLANLLAARGRLYIEAHQPQLAVADFEQAKKVLPGSSPDFIARLKAYIKTAESD